MTDTLEAAVAAITADLPILDEIPPPSSPNLPDDFWTARPHLAHIRQAAHAQARSADAVFGATLARVAVLTPPWVCLPNPVGTEGTLDLFVALVGSSGTGKSSSAKVAAQLLPIDDDGVDTVSLGSGEGIIEAYLDFVTEEDEEGKKRKVKRQVRRGILAMLDEGQALAEMGKRQGATLLPTLRSAWTGDRLGQANASEERKRHLAPGEYRLALVAGFQLEHATALLDDVDGGTPQRFLYLPAEDPAIPDEAPPWPGPLPWQPGASQAHTMGLDADVATEIRRRALARSRGEVTIDPLDAHRDLSRLKVAGLLSILDGRHGITAADWALAGTVLATSDRVRASIIATAQHRALYNERKQTERLARQAAGLADDAAQRAIAGMARAIARHVHRDTCDGGCRRRCVTQATKSTHRKVATIDEALTEAANKGWILLDGDLLKPGGEQP